MKHFIDLGAFVSGFVMVGWGAWWIYPPAGLLSMGAILMTLVCLSKRSGYK